MSTHSSFNNVDTIEFEYNLKHCHVSNSKKLTGIGWTSSPGRVPNSFYLENCVLENNYAPFKFMAAYKYATNNIFQNNYATALWSGLGGYPLEIANSLFLNNQSPDGPGAIFASTWANIRIYNNTFYGNTGSTYSTIGIGHLGSVDIANNIFWNNLTASGIDIGVEILPETSPSHLNCSIRNCVLQNDISSVNDQPFITFDSIYTSYPEFIDTTVLLNLNLASNSTVINKGGQVNCEILGYRFNMDLNNNPRVFEHSIDIGAYEYIPTETPTYTYVTTDTLTCVNDSLTLKAYSNDRFAYAWYKNGTLLANKHNDTLTIPSTSDDDMGYYKARVASLTDTLFSDSLQLQLENIPQITSQNYAVGACVNSPAEFWLNTSSSAIEPSYHWESILNGILTETSNTYYIEQAHNSDTLVATVSTVCGIAMSDTMVLTVFPTPKPMLGNDTTLSTNDSLLLDAGVFNSYTWSTGSFESQIYLSETDTVWVDVSNEYGCIASDTIIITMAPTSLNESFNGKNVEILIYPNPVTDILYIQPHETIDLPYRLSIYSEEDKLIELKNIEEHGIQSLEIEADMGSGSYILRIDSKNIIGNTKFIVK